MFLLIALCQWFQIAGVNSNFIVRKAPIAWTIIICEWHLHSVVLFFTKTEINTARYMNLWTVFDWNTEAVSLHSSSSLKKHLQLKDRFTFIEVYLNTTHALMYIEIVLHMGIWVFILSQTVICYAQHEGITTKGCHACKEFSFCAFNVFNYLKNKSEKSVMSFLCLQVTFNKSVSCVCLLQTLLNANHYASIEYLQFSVMIIYIKIYLSDIWQWLMPHVIDMKCLCWGG